MKGQVDSVSDEVDFSRRTSKSLPQVINDRFINGDGLVAQAGKEFRKKMHGQRLMDGGDMGDAREFGGLRRDPVRPARVRVNDLNALGPDEGSHPPRVDDAHGNSFAVDGHGLVSLTVVKPVRDPEHFVSSVPGLSQRETVGFRPRRF